MAAIITKADDWSVLSKDGLWPASALLHALGVAGQLLHLCLLSYFKRIVDFNAEVANSAFQLRMP